MIVLEKKLKKRKHEINDKHYETDDGDNYNARFDSLYNV